MLGGGLAFGKVLPPACPVGVEPALEQVDAFRVLPDLGQQGSSLRLPEVHEIPAGELTINDPATQFTGIVIQFHCQIPAAHL